MKSDSGDLFAEGGKNAVINQDAAAHQPPTGAVAGPAAVPVPVPVPVPGPGPVPVNQVQGTDGAAVITEPLKATGSGELRARTPPGQVAADNSSVEPAPLKIGSDLEKQNKITVVEVTNFHKFAFCLMGFADLFFWNCILSILWDIREFVYTDYPQMTDTLNATNMMSSVVVAVYCVWSGAVNHTITITAAFGFCVAAVATACCVQWAPGLTGVILIHFANIIAGAASGLYQTGAVGLASVISEVLNGYISTGAGICGVVTWALWRGISASSLDTKGALWVLMALAFLVAATGGIFFWIISRQPAIAERSKEVRESLRTEATNPDAPSYLFLLKRCWKPIFAIFFNMYITLFFFPNIGPLNWGAGDNTNWIMGGFQFGDLIGRYMPVLIPMVVYSVNTAFLVSLGRTLFLVLAILVFAYKEKAFFSHVAWQVVLIACMAITSGWNVSCIFMKTPDVIPQADWRSRVGSLLVLGLLTGIAGGLWSARIFTAVHVD